MQWRFDPTGTPLIPLMMLLPFACSPSGTDGDPASGGSQTGSGAGTGGARTGSGGASAGAGNASSGSGGTGGSSGGQLGSGGSVGATGGAASGSSGAPGSGGQTGSGGGSSQGGSTGDTGGAGGTATGIGGRTDSGGSPPNSGGGAVGGGGAGKAGGGGGGKAGAGGAGAAGAGGIGAAGGCDEANGYHLSPRGDMCTNAPRALCIFDYDLVLSSHSCAQTTAKPTEYLCRTNACTTSNWHDQCLATAAHTAIAECVRHGAFIGITSHSAFDECFNDKVIQTLTPAAFPELYSSIHYNKSGTDFTYPALDTRANWNCDTCAYHFDGKIGGSKAALIRKVMAHYGLSPTAKADQSRVLYWEDDPANIKEISTNLPNVTTIAVTSTNPATAGSGCGISAANVTAGWAALAANSP